MHKEPLDIVEEISGKKKRSFKDTSSLSCLKDFYANGNSHLSAGDFLLFSIIENRFVNHYIMCPDSYFPSPSFSSPQLSPPHLPS